MMERNVVFRKHLNSIESRLRVECEILRERRNGEYIESLNIDFQPSDRVLRQGLIQRAFVANYMCEESDGTKFLKPIVGTMMIYFRPGEMNTSCEGRVLKELYKVRIKQ